jgi:hypothetical protein
MVRLPYIRAQCAHRTGRKGLFNLVKSLPPTLKCESRTIVGRAISSSFTDDTRGLCRRIGWWPTFFVSRTAFFASTGTQSKDEATEANSKSGLPM